MDPKFLHQIPFFSHLDDEKTDVVLKAFKEKEFKKGDVIMHQDEQANGMYVIISGEVEVEMDGKVVTSLETNDFFGEMALVAHEPRSATIKVISDKLSTLFLSRKTFEHIHDELGEDVKQEMLQRIIENYEDFNS
jgi:CRP-like cAMP-binding protein